MIDPAAESIPWSGSPVRGMVLVDLSSPATGLSVLSFG